MVEFPHFGVTCLGIELLESSNNSRSSTPGLVAAAGRSRCAASSHTVPSALQANHRSRPYARHLVIRPFQRQCRRSSGISPVFCRWRWIDSRKCGGQWPPGRVRDPAPLPTWLRINLRRSDLAVAGTDGGCMPRSLRETFAHVQIPCDLIFEHFFPLQQQSVAVAAPGSGCRKPVCHCQRFPQDRGGLVFVPIPASLLKAQFVQFFFHEHALGFDVVAQEIAFLGCDARHRCRPLRNG